MITYISSRGKNRKVKKDLLLGQGQTGQVYSLKTLNNKKLKWVCKKIVIDSFGRRRKLLTTFNELKILKQLQLLEGYVRKKNTFYIIIKKISGKQPKRNVTFKELVWCFKALRLLHRENVTHFDTHQGNYIINSKENKATLIDFSFSQPITYINQYWDFFDFFYNYHLSFSLFLKLYVLEIIDYVRQHPLDIAIYVICLGALFLSAVYGIPFLSVTHLMVQQLIKNIIINQLISELASKGLNHFLAILLGCYMNNVKLIKKIMRFGEYLQKALSLYWLASHAQRYFLQYLGSKSLHAGSVYLISFCVTFKHFLADSTKVIDSDLLPESCIKKRADLLFSYPHTIKKTNRRRRSEPPSHWPRPRLKNRY